MNKVVLLMAALAAAFSSCGNTPSGDDAAALKNARASYDVLIVGGGASGTAAAIQAARSGVSVLLVEEHEWLGGMLTSAGVSATDGCYLLRGGIWSEFRDSLEAEYGGAEALKSGWVSNVLFSPRVGARIFSNIAAKEKNLDVLYNCIPSSYSKKEHGWTLTLSSEGYDRKIDAALLVDGTELGDVAKAVGASYKVGMDSRYDTGEECAPEKAVNIVQDITMVMTLKDYGRPVPIPEPEGYDPEEFRCCCRHEKCPDNTYDWTPSYMMKYGKIGNDRYMINWPLHGNDYYLNLVEMTPEERLAALEEAKHRSLCFLYYLQNEFGYVNLGIADDEYATEDGFPFIPYHRESRRIDGKVRFTVNDILEPYSQKTKLYRTAIAVGDYPVDHHHNMYRGEEPLPQIDFPTIPSYGLPVGVMMPAEIRDFLVIEKSISVTNIVNGSTRLQPVVLQLGQAAGVVAADAIKGGCQPGEVSVRSVQRQMLEAGAYLYPLLDVEASSPVFASYQRIAATGILRYFGRHVGWVNQSWLDADKPMLASDLVSGISEFYLVDGKTEGVEIPGTEAEQVSADYLASVIAALSGADAGKVREHVSQVLSSVPAGVFDVSEDRLTRGQTAVVIDKILDPFNAFDVDLEGNLK